MSSPSYTDSSTQQTVSITWQQADLFKSWGSPFIEMDTAPDDGLVSVSIGSSDLDGAVVYLDKDKLDWLIDKLSQVRSRF